MSLPEVKDKEGGEAWVSDPRPPRQNFPSAIIPHLVALALLLTFLAIFFARFTVDQRVLSSADLIFTDYPWATSPPDDYTGPSNPYQSDDVNLGYPRRWALYNGSGNSWWQDDYLGGTRSTFAVDFFGQQLYPPAWVYNLFPFHVATSLFPIFMLLAAGLSMYLLLWQCRLGWLASVYGALLFMLNSHFIAWVGAPSLPAELGLIPLMIFGFERYDERRQPLYLLIPVACLAMQIYLAYIPAWAVAGVVLCVYGIVRGAPLVFARQFNAIVGRLGIYAGTAVLGVLLSAYSLIGTITSASESSYQTGRSLGLLHYPLGAAWMYLFPSYWGTVYEWLAPSGNFLEWVGYVPITAAPLAIVGIWQLRRSWLAWFAVTILVFSASQAYGIPPFKELANLPVMKQIAPGRWLFGVDLAGSLLAPLGLQVMLGSERSPSTRRRLAVVVSALLLLTFAVVGVLWAERHDTASWRLIAEGRHLIPRPWELTDELETYSTQFHRQLLLLTAAAGLVIGGLVLRPPTWRLAAVALLGLAFVDIFAFGFRFDGSVKREDLYPETPALAFLRRDNDLFRVAPVAADGGRLVMPGYLPTLYGLQSITGYDHYRNEDYRNFLSPMLSKSDDYNFDNHGYLMLGSSRQPLNRNILSALNVKYVLASPTGVFDEVASQEGQDTAFPVYATVRQGQALSISSPRPDAIEFLLATGGGPAPDSPVIIHVKRAPTDTTDQFTISLAGRDILDNSWHRIDLPDASTLPDGPLFVEIEAPEATADHPLYVWGTGQSTTDELQRFESGVRTTGNLVFRLLRKPAPWLSEVYSGKDLAVYRIDGALPRAWGVGDVEIVKSKADAVTRVAEENFDPAATVVLAEDSFSGKPLANRGEFEAEMTRYEPGSMTVRTQFTAPGYLVLSTRFDDGWVAKIDGSNVPIIRADGILQAVEVGPGEHTVTMSFRPWEYVWGKRISLVSTTLLILGIALYVARLTWNRTRRAA